MENRRLFFGLFLCTLAFLPSCFDTPYKEGRDLYTFYCENCHGDNGVGLLALIPPIAGSDYLVKNRDSLACIIQYGLQGKITVNNRVYDEMMPGIGTLKPAEVANIINYINTSFGNDLPPVRLPDVEKRLKECVY